MGGERKTRTIRELLKPDVYWTDLSEEEKDIMAKHFRSQGIDFKRHDDVNTDANINSYLTEKIDKHSNPNSIFYNPNHKSRHGKHDGSFMRGLNTIWDAFWIILGIIVLLIIIF